MTKTTSQYLVVFLIFAIKNWQRPVEMKQLGWGEGGEPWKGRRRLWA